MPGRVVGQYVALDAVEEQQGRRERPIGER
jgi:hypothetical protein